MFVKRPHPLASPPSKSRERVTRAIARSLRRLRSLPVSRLRAVVALVLLFAIVRVGMWQLSLAPPLAGAGSRAETASSVLATGVVAMEGVGTRRRREAVRGP
jgi:hypothetical protein